MIFKRGLSYLPDRKTRPISKDGLNVIPCGTGSLCQPDTSFSPTDLPNLALWLDAMDSSTITTETGVSEWKDKSGNNNHYTQSSTALQPAYTSNTVVFSQGAKRLENALTLPSSATIIAVYGEMTASVTNGSFFMDALGSNALIPLALQGSIQSEQYRPDITSPVSYKNGQSINPLTRGEVFTELFTEAETLYTYYLALANISDSDRIGCRDAEDYRSRDLKELIIVDGTVSEEDRLKAENYLNSKWGVY